MNIHVWFKDTITPTDTKTAAPGPESWLLYQDHCWNRKLEVLIVSVFRPRSSFRSFFVVVVVVVVFANRRREGETMVFSCLDHSDH